MLEQFNNVFGKIFGSGNVNSYNYNNDFKLHLRNDG